MELQQVQAKQQAADVRLSSDAYDLAKAWKDKGCLVVATDDTGTVLLEQALGVTATAALDAQPHSRVQQAVDPRMLSACGVWFTQLCCLGCGTLVTVQAAAVSWQRQQQQVPKGSAKPPCCSQQ